MSAFKLRPISCLYLLTLLTGLPMVNAATTNECAILATGAASDLAVDDPRRFEYLTQACGNQRPAPPIASRSAQSAPGAQKQGKPSPKAGGSSKPNALQRVADTPGTGDDQEGCPYLFYPVNNSRHPIGTEGCKDGRTHICRKNAKGVVDWDKVEGSSCSGANVRDLKAIEFNHREAVLTNEKMSKE